MFRRLSVTLLLLSSTVLLAGCGRGTGPGQGAVPGTDVTLHVPDMTQRQGLT